MTTSTKLCIDCRHCTASTLEQAKADAPMCMKGAKSVVDGSYVDACWRQREGMGGWPIFNQPLAVCGPDGDWWEQRTKANTGATP